MSVWIYSERLLKKGFDPPFYGLTHSAFARKGRFRFGLLCFLQRLTQTIMPS
jgi:hypothetical protein